MSLIDKLRKAREVVKTIGGFDFTIRRPTQLEMLEIQNQPRGRAILPYVVGWSGVREMDLVPGGDPHPLPFAPELRDEWLVDRIDLLVPLADAVFEVYREHEARLEDAKKN